MQDQLDEYELINRIGKSHVGTILRFPDNEEERVWFSPHNAPKEHNTVLEAALWVRDDRPNGASKYKTYIYRSLESGRGRSRVSDGAYAGTYMEAVEWIEEKAAEYDGQQIKWLDLPKIVVDLEDEDRVEELL